MLIWKPWVSRISVTGAVYFSMNCCSKMPKRPQNNTGPCHSSTSELEDKTQVLIDYIIVARYREIKPEQKLKLFLFWLCFIKQENAVQLSRGKKDTRNITQTCILQTIIPPCCTKHAQCSNSSPTTMGITNIALIKLDALCRRDQSQIHG